MRPALTILAINTGSSSIKFTLYGSGDTEEMLLSGSLTRIGLPEGRFSVQDGDGRFIESERVSAPDHEAACAHVFSWLRDHESGEPDAIGHRIVHGGSDYSSPEMVTGALLDTVERFVPYAPEHLPQALHAVRYATGFFPGIFQVACFDTAFHRTMPEVARRYALPAVWREAGVQRYGFHGLSYEYILTELKRLRDPRTVRGRVIIAHLGHGASMVALLDGRSVDTTMGFSPAGGLVMSTRTGDLDPGVLLFLMRRGKLDPDALGTLINRRSGLLGVSGSSNDMKELLDIQKNDGDARAAVDLFCYQARKYVGSLSAVLGGLDMVVFTGGIGENSPEIRRRICSGFAYLGLKLDEGKNRENLPMISPEAAPVCVRVMTTNEELMIARQTRRVLEER